jgi:hypothetical protein
MIKTSLCTCWFQYKSFLPHYLAQSDCLAAYRQGQGDTRLTITSSVIPNSNYVIMVSDSNCLKYFCVFCTVIIRCHRDFWSPSMCVDFIHHVWSDLVRSKTMKWAEHVVRLEEKRRHTVVWWQNLQEWGNFEDLGLDLRKYYHEFYKNNME